MFAGNDTLPVRNIFHTGFGELWSGGLILVASSGRWCRQAALRFSVLALSESKSVDASETEKRLRGTAVTETSVILESVPSRHGHTETYSG